MSETLSTNTANSTATSGLRRFVPNLPLVVWMVLFTLVIGFAGGLSADQVISDFNLGFGRALGEFALILLPSFTLAAALSGQNVASDAAGRTAALASPVAGAGMICPDTAYAALSPAAGRYKLDTAFGAYAGFKLLYPAGPLIVAAGLGALGPDGIDPMTLMLCGLGLTLPVWGAGAVWVRAVDPRSSADAGRTHHTNTGQLLIAFLPFLLLAALLIIGSFITETRSTALSFLFMPKGALLAAAVLAVLQTPPGARRACLDSAVRRTGSLLLIIGAASAFGALLTGLLPLDRLAPQGNGMLALLALFGITVLFKLAQGSSMATFAAIGPVAAPIVSASGTHEIAAVFAICLGSFVAILPNDSYFWLVRRDALAEERSEGRAIFILTGGAVTQALAGLAILLLVVTLWS